MEGERFFLDFVSEYVPFTSSTMIVKLLFLSSTSKVCRFPFACTRMHTHAPNTHTHTHTHTHGHLSSLLVCRVTSLTKE